MGFERQGMVWRKTSIGGNDAADGQEPSSMLAAIPSDPASDPVARQAVATSDAPPMLPICQSGSAEERLRQYQGKSMATKKVYLPLVGALAFLFTTAAAASTGQEIAEQGNARGAPPCASCHGSRYQGDASLHTPALAGLPASFILSRLAHYAGPDGHNSAMRQVATALSLPERNAIAAYLSTLPRIEDGAH
jgi:cytochrome c553